MFRDMNLAFPGSLCYASAQNLETTDGFIYRLITLTAIFSVYQLSLSSAICFTHTASVVDTSNATGKKQYD